MLSKCLLNDRMSNHMGTLEQYHLGKQGICLGPALQSPLNFGKPSPTFSKDPIDQDWPEPEMLSRQGALGPP